MPDIQATRDLYRLIRWVAILGVALVIVVGLALVLFVKDVRNEARSNDVSGCNRGNLVRGYLVGRAQQLPPTKLGDAAPTLFPLLVCNPDGDFTTMSKGEADKFIAILSEGKEPVVKDGIVVGSRPLPLP